MDRGEAFGLLPMMARANRFSATMAAAVIGAAALVAETVARAEMPTGVFTYSIHSERFGEVGVYTNVIRRDGASVIVENRTEITIKFLFATVYRLTAESTAVWRDGRIVRFDGVTDDDGRRFEVRGRADGERFVIEGTAGRFVAPAAVYPHNPWNIGILHAGAIMSPKSGRVFTAVISAGLADDGAPSGSVPDTVIWRIDTDRRTWVWSDRNDIPVKFVMERKRGRELLSFTLDRAG